MRRVYLDHNASTPVHPDVLAAMMPYFSERFGNASSIHGFGREARDGIDLAREKIAGFLRLLSLYEDRYVPISSYSKGMRQKILLAAALLHNPELVLLDEPGSGLDPDETEALGELLVDLARDGMAILLVEHDVELVMRICADLYVLDFGEVIAHGTPKQVQADGAVQAAYLGVEVPA